jgi:hypothetical protein
VVHVEDEVIVEVPEARRWCDRLEFTTRRVNVGENSNGPRFSE